MGAFSPKESTKKTFDRNAKPPPLCGNCGKKQQHPITGYHGRLLAVPGDFFFYGSVFVLLISETDVMWGRPSVLSIHPASPLLECHYS